MVYVKKPKYFCLGGQLLFVKHICLDIPTSICTQISSKKTTFLQFEDSKCPSNLNWTELLASVVNLSLLVKEDCQDPQPDQLKVIWLVFRTPEVRILII